MPPPTAISFLLLFILSLSSHLAHHPPLAAAAAQPPPDAVALLALKSALDASGRLPWRAATAPAFCASWPGVRQCDHRGRVTKLVLEGLNLTGALTVSLLAPLAELRVLSLKSNALTGPIPEALPRALPNLKLLYLSDNRLEGRIPGTLALLHRATVIVLSDNRLTGEIPASLATVPRLTSLLLDGNLLTGPVPALPQPTLRLLNVSGNRLSGEIPAVLASRFNASSFLGNAAAGGLCGPPLPTRCVDAASPGPSNASTATAALPPSGLSSNSRRRRRKNAAIVAGATVAGAVVLCLLVAAAVVASRRGRNKQRADSSSKVAAAATATAAAQPGEVEAQTSAAAVGREFSWEREGGMGKLVFCGGNGNNGGDGRGREVMYSLEELLRASAETLGRGETGSTYKAVMETGYIVTVKRMRGGDGDGGAFGRRAEEVGRVRHPNVVAVRAYFQAKEERLLVYDYYPNGSLFSLVHGSRPSSKGKPLHWTSCMKIAEDIAAGLSHLHSDAAGRIVHGNLKPSNVLLGPDFESCLTDYGLVPSLLPTSSSSDLLTGASSTSLSYRAPETRSTGVFTPASDVYSFGVLLLELLTGRTPFQDQLADVGPDDIPAWVRAVREEESMTATTTTESGGDGGSAASGAAAEEKLGALVGIAAACVAADPGRRPGTAEVLRMVREARAEAMSSSNSSDRSPARWSRDHHGAVVESFNNVDRE